MDDKKTLQLTQTGGVVQPIRLYYQIIDEKRLLDRFKRLRCIDSDPVNNRWVWLYADEAKRLKFEKPYSSIPKELHSIVIGSFFLRSEDESLLLDLRSFDRALEAIPFFDKHIDRNIARITHAAVVNRLFGVKELFPPNLDGFFCNSEITKTDTSKGTPEIEKFPVHFYEDGIDSITAALRMRQIMAHQHWNGNADCTLLDIIETAVSRMPDDAN